MHCRDINDAEFTAIASDMIAVQRQEGAIEVVNGWHGDLGTVVMIRDSTRCLAAVDNPEPLDRLVTERGLKADASAPSRAIGV